MQTFLFLFESFGVYSWLYLLGCVLAGAAFAHTSWAYKQTQILHLRREQSRLRQALALRANSLSLQPAVDFSRLDPAPEHLQQAPRTSFPESRLRVAPRSITHDLLPVPTRKLLQEAPTTGIHCTRTPRKNSLREDRQLGLVFFVAPEEPDPLDRLPSITCAQIRDLNMLGIYKFEQIARWNETNLQSFAQLLGMDRDHLARLDWVHQAKILHGETHGSKMVLAS
jgi:hypothetical protein